MLENNSSAAKPDSPPDELNFATPAAQTPRIKRRSLKAKQATSLKPVNSVPPSAWELAREAPPLAIKEVRPEFKPQPEHDDDAEINAAVKITEPAPVTPQPAPVKPTVAPSQPQTASTVKPTPASSQPTTSTPTASPHGTRPATLYYSSGVRKEKEEPAPMKSTPSASAPTATATPTPSSTPTPTSAPVRSTPATTSKTSSARPATITDYRANIDRQTKEQKSVGSALAIVVYVLIGFFVIGASLAGYGTYVLSKQLQRQSVTIDELDKHYAAETQALKAQLKTTNDTLAQAQAQLGRQQELILKQQEAINKLMAADDATTTALHQEKFVRASETASLRARVRDLENRELTR